MIIFKFYFSPEYSTDDNSTPRDPRKRKISSDENLTTKNSDPRLRKFSTDENSTSKLPELTIEQRQDEIIHNPNVNKSPPKKTGNVKDPRKRKPFVLPVISHQPQALRSGASSLFDAHASIETETETENQVNKDTEKSTESTESTKSTETAQIETMQFYKDLPNFKSMSASIDIAYKANEEFEELIDVYVGVCINDCKEPTFEEIQNVIGVFIGNGFFNFEELQLAMATLPGTVEEI